MASGVKFMAWTIRDAARIESVTSPKSVAAALSTARTLLAFNSCRMFLTHSALKSSILVPKVSNRVMHVDNVFRALVAIASPMDKYFLCKETDRICNPIRLSISPICSSG